MDANTKVINLLIIFLFHGSVSNNHTTQFIYWLIRGELTFFRISDPILKRHEGQGSEQMDRNVRLTRRISSFLLLRLADFQSWVGMNQWSRMVGGSNSLNVPLFGWFGGWCGPVSSRDTVGVILVHGGFCEEKKQENFVQKCSRSSPV